MVSPYRLVGFHDHHSSNVVDFTTAVEDIAGAAALPVGGSEGQALVKDSGSDGDATWHNIEDIATAETDDTKRLAPDGLGGVEFVAGGSGGAHDIISADHTDTDTADTPADGDVLIFSTADNKWHPAPPPGGGGSSYYAHRVWLSNALTTFNVNNTSYVTSIAFEFNVDLDEFPFADFRIVLVGQSNAAGQTIAAQLATVSNPGTAIHTGGNDIASIPNAQALYDSGWRSRDDGATGLKGYAVAFKGSNSTVDMQVFYIDVLLRI